MIRRGGSSRRQRHRTLASGVALTEVAQFY
jgi:hypothetical protein